MQSVLVGYVSQFFCEKKSLEDELSRIKLRRHNATQLIASIEEEIETTTRDAYLFATGLIVVTFYVSIHHTWVFYWSQKIGMMSRIAVVGAIFNKVITFGCTYCFDNSLQFRSYCIILILFSRDCSLYMSSLQCDTNYWLNYSKILNASHKHSSIVYTDILTFPLPDWLTAGPACICKGLLFVFHFCY